jgi:hypothetical protein
MYEPRNNGMDTVDTRQARPKEPRCSQPFQDLLRQWLAESSARGGSFFSSEATRGVPGDQLWIEAGREEWPLGPASGLMCFVPRTHASCENHSRLNDGRQNGLKGGGSKELFPVQVRILSP